MDCQERERVLEQVLADKFETDLKNISLEADAAAWKARANGYRKED